jgi:MOSC domain-containing protein YiiM
MRKWNEQSIELLEGLGVKDDAHMGKTVKHRSRVAKDPLQPNLRQVHLIHSELHSELKEKGFQVSAGDMGENITTEGVDLLNLPQNTVLKIGSRSQIKITGLRNPCSQLDGIQPGLMKAVLARDESGQLVRKAGIMGVVLCGGAINVGDTIEIELPHLPHLKLEKV